MLIKVFENWISRDLLKNNIVSIVSQYDKDVIVYFTEGNKVDFYNATPDEVAEEINKQLKANK